MSNQPEKIQKVLARCGVASRRAIEEMIIAERITINDELALIGTRVSDSDIIKVDGKLITVANPAVTKVIIYNKPINQICTRTDPEGRTTVFEQLPPLLTGRWISVGRLDFKTSGLLILTDDGELANKLMHPSYEIPRVYKVRVRGQVNDQTIARLQKGLELEDGLAKFDTLEIGKSSGANQWFTVSLHSGRNHLVRRMWREVGHPVNKLIRISFGPIELPLDLELGQWQELSVEQLNSLQDAVG